MCKFSAKIVAFDEISRLPAPCICSAGPKYSDNAPSIFAACKSQQHVKHMESVWRGILCHDQQLKFHCLSHSSLENVFVFPHLLRQNN